MSEIVDVTFDELRGFIESSVQAGESWLFTQNKHPAGWENFRRKGQKALNGDWDVQPQKKTTWIAHWTSLTKDADTPYCLWVGRKGGEPLPVADGRFQLQMKNIVGYRVRDVPAKGSSFAQLLGCNVGNVYTYVGDSADATKPKSTDGLAEPAFTGDMIQRLTWHRVNHHKFRGALENRFEGRCAVLLDACNGLLVASHIVPWRSANPHERVDVNNGLLLSAPLDALFDRGLIGFDDEGRLLMSANLSEVTLRAFGLHDGLRINRDAFESKVIPDAMTKYFARHRSTFGLT